MPLQLRQATEADAPACGRIATAAFVDTLSPTLFPPHLNPGPDDEVTWRTQRTARRIREGVPTLVVVETDPDSGKEIAVAGFAQWQKPYPPAGSEEEEKEEVLDAAAKAKKEAEKDPGPPSLDVTVFELAVQIMDEETEKAFGERGYKDMWYLMMLAVDPQFNRRGVGKMLLRWGVDQATADKKDVFLVATPAGRFLYLSAGFKDIWHRTLINVPHTGMLWELPGKEASA
ncbi:acyl-CoA N-acyltransferase [Podospora didyma]|uniref:Acyl-CoA N-acyltransferase n=1 Tax=Podospora didyma TaxID=330526 RepID=A0AAE0KAL1_9PEZI|nr:acyl-CoA N-acyltransferase [Podospora didyma]